MALLAHAHGSELGVRMPWGVSVALAAALSPHSMLLDNGTAARCDPTYVQLLPHPICRTSHHGTRLADDMHVCVRCVKLQWPTMLPKRQPDLHAARGAHASGSGNRQSPGAAQRRKRIR